MNIILVDKLNDIESYSCVALHKKLYVKGRLAKGVFEKPEKIVRLSLAIENDILGWGMISLPKNILGVFVEKKWRGHGLGKKLIEKVVEGFSGQIKLDDRVSFYKEIGLFNNTVENFLKGKENDIK